MGTTVSVTYKHVLLHNNIHIHTHTPGNDKTTLVGFVQAIIKDDMCSDIPGRHQRPRKRSLMSNTDIKGTFHNYSCCTFGFVFFPFCVAAGFKWPLSRVSVPQGWTRGMHKYFSTLLCFVLFFLLFFCLLQVGFMNACNRLLSLTWNLLKVHICS